MSTIRLAVNGTLMRDFELNGNLIAAGATFTHATTTSPHYRLWSIDDRHPAMVRAGRDGAAIAVEVWEVPAAGLAAILLAEPSGLCVGKVRLADGEETLGVLGEPALCEGSARDHQIRRLARPTSPPGRQWTAAEVERLAALLGLPLEPGSAAPVAAQLAGLLASARLFAEFPLPDNVEPAPVFRP
jgi:hypothetical protein